MVDFNEIDKTIPQDNLLSSRRSRSVRVPSSSAAESRETVDSLQRNILAPTSSILDSIGSTPLVRLSRLFPDASFKLFGKLESLNPGGSIKDRPAREIIEAAIREGVVTTGTVVIESSSGNMGIGLAQACRYHGLRFICVVDCKTTEQNLLILRAYGAEVDLVLEPDPETGELLQARLNRVRQLLDRHPRSFWPNQYANTNNSGSHYRMTMREIAHALDGDVDLLFVATSTCGTLRGCGEYVRDHGLSTRIIAVDARGSLIFADRKAERSIPGLGAGLRPPLCDLSLVSECIHVSDLDCVLGCRQMVEREAILCGGSSGGVVAAVARYRSRIPPGATCVAILPDRGERYLDTIYSEEWLGARFAGDELALVDPLEDGDAGDRIFAPGGEAAAGSNGGSAAILAGAGPADMVDLLRRRAEKAPDRLLYRFLADGEREASRLTAGQLDLRARRIAANLQARGSAGERVLLLFPPGLDFVAAFFGCLYAGAVAVPAHPPRRKNDTRLAGIVRGAEPRLGLTTRELLPRLGIASASPAADPTWLVEDDLDADEAAGWRRPALAGEDLAFLQYTSGSTSAPRGVRVSHGNLLANLELIRRAFRQDLHSRVVSWLPLYHDMGLIGALMQPLYVGAEAVLMSPVSFLQRPARWLEAISRFAADTSGGPNFAYELCCRRIDAETRERLDLGSWRVAFDGAEPVRPETLDRFAATFGPCGFRRSSFVPCYGLAEATLLVAGAAGGGARERAVNPGDLERHRVVAASGAGARRLAASGPVPEGVEVVVVHPRSRRPVEAGRIGEIWIAGPSVASGYWDEPQETERAFAASTADGRGPFLRSGDLGFVEDGQLFVTGRAKDLIVIRGRNLYPQDVEATVADCDPELRPGSGAAFSVEAAGEEALVVVQEVPRRPRFAPEELAVAVQRAVVEEHEVQVHELVLVGPGGVPKTSSGKVRRGACRDAYLRGALAAVVRRRAESELPAVTSGAASKPGDASAEADDAGRGVARLVAGVLGRGALDPRQPLVLQGLDSLTAAELQNALATELGLRASLSDLLSGASVEALLDLPAAAGAATPSAVPADDSLLSWGQRALWLVDRLAPDNGALHVAFAARVLSALDVPALRRALDRLAERHESLRTAFLAGDDGPRRRVLAPAPVDFATLSVAGDELQPALAAEAYRTFDLAAGRLLRVRLVHSGDDPALLVVLHHLVCDFASCGLLVRELSILYAAERGAEGAAAAELPPAVPTYGQYVAWEARQVEGAEGERALRHWQEELAGELPVLALPVDRPRPPVQGHVGGVADLELDAALSGELERLGRRLDVTLHAVLLAGFVTLLHRHAGQDDLTVGLPAAGRLHGELESVVGYLVRPLVLRCRLADGPGFAGLVTRVANQTSRGLDHQVAPFAQLVERLQPRRDPSRSPLFQALFVLYRGRPGEEELASFAAGRPGATLELADLRLQAVPLAERRAQLELTLAAARAAEAIHLSLDYDRDLFEAATADRLLAHLRNLLAAALAEPDRAVRDLELMSAGERRQVLCEWGTGPAEEPASVALLPELIARQAATTPDAVAVVGAGQRLSYGELDRRADRLAGELALRGVGPEVMVGVLLARTPDLLVALLAVWKAAGAYVPLDPRYPEGRLGALVDDARCALVITDAAHGGRLGDRVARLVLAAGAAGGRPGAAAPRRDLLPSQLAYLIYTSGSTGTPKGVAIEHRSAAALARWSRQRFDDRELAGVLAATSVGFDLSVFELFAPLCWGGRVVLAEDALHLPGLEAASEVTLINTVPSVMAELAARGSLPPAVVTVSLAGEVLSRSLGERLHATRPGLRLLNLYGPSEDTTYSTESPVPPGSDREPPIGRPLPATRAYVLDRPGRLAPAGVAGELALAGGGMARGYFRRAAATAERFVPDPFSERPGERMYRTGDLVRWRHGGDLEFLGRVDRQVKVRGVRIEPGEIEAALTGHPRVREAAVMMRRNGAAEPSLVAYTVAGGDSPAAAELRSHLARILPDAMLPAAFVTLARMPRTPHGKIDRRALPAPRLDAEDAASAQREPRDEVEALLATLWSDVLGRPRAWIDDDFFDLGGHSLQAARLASRVSSAFGAELPLTAVFRHPTPARLAAWLAEARPAARTMPVADLGPDPSAGPHPLSFAQRRLWFLAQLQPGSAAYNMAAAVDLEGDLAPAALEAALSDVLERHAALRSRFGERDAEPYQETMPPPLRCLPRLDISSLPEERRRRQAAALARAEARRPFRLVGEAPFRARLLRLAAGRHELLLTAHHIVADGWSLEVFFRDLAAAYAARAGDGPPLPRPALQYAHYARWQQRAWSFELEAEDLAFWRDRLTPLPACELPADRPRQAVARGRGGRVEVSLPEAAGDGLASFCRRASVTPFTAFVALLQVLLSRYCGEPDVVVGVPLADRHRPELFDVVGLFVNLAPICARSLRGRSFAAAVGAARQAVLEAHDRRRVPFEALVRELAVPRAADRHPLFQVAVVEAEPLQGRAAAGVTFQPRPVDTGTAKLDLTLEVAARAASPRLVLEYDRDLFDRVTVERLAASLLELLRAALERPELPVDRLPALGGAARRQVVEEWNRTERPVPELPVHRLVSQVAVRRPDAVAVVHGREALTYGELARRAAGWSTELRRQGVGPEVVVGVLLERSIDLVVALLAVLEAGGAYLPIDPAYPRERVRDMLRDAAAPLLLTVPRFATLAPAGCRPLCFSAAAVPPGPPGPPAGEDGGGERLAYVVFTSGSTGRPKGVAVPHRGLSNLVAWHRGAYQPGAEDRATHLASAGFDAAVWEIWPSLAAGAALELAPAAVVPSPPALVSWLRERQVTLTFLPTPLAEGALGELERVGAPLRALLTGGDRLRQRPGRGLPFPLVNHYGPTESSVVATSGAVAAGEAVPPPIGRPIANTRLFLLDRAMQPVPAGAIGEIFLGGRGVARGYLGRPAATAEAFLPDPFGGPPGGRLYRTGDLARHRPHGDLDFLGRRDRQLKVRGVRVEPGEIEAVLLRHPAVVQAAVVAVDAPARLVAYVATGGAGAGEPEELREHLRRHLPEAMVPAELVVLERLPLTANGKIDRAALPVPQRAPAAFDPPRGRLEALLAELWADLLEVERVGRDEDFFALGGHSLQLGRMLLRVRDELGVELSPLTVFQAPTVARLAVAVAEALVAQSQPEAVRRALAEIEGLGTSEESLAK